MVAHAGRRGMQAKTCQNPIFGLPAPLGPMNPVTWPGPTVNDMPSSATVDPNRLRSPVTSMVASFIGPVVRGSRFQHGAGR